MVKWVNSSLAKCSFDQVRCDCLEVHLSVNFKKVQLRDCFSSFPQVSVTFLPICAFQQTENYDIKTLVYVCSMCGIAWHFYFVFAAEVEETVGKVGVMAINIKCTCMTFCQCTSLCIKLFGILDANLTVSPSFVRITKANVWWLA